MNMKISKAATLSGFKFPGEGFKNQECNREGYSHPDQTMCLATDALGEIREPLFWNWMSMEFKSILLIVWNFLT